MITIKITADERNEGMTMVAVAVSQQLIALGYQVEYRGSGEMMDRRVQARLRGAFSVIHDNHGRKVLVVDGDRKK